MLEEDYSMKLAFVQWRKRTVRRSFLNLNQPPSNRIIYLSSLLVYLFIFHHCSLGYERLDDPKELAAHPAPTRVRGGSRNPSSSTTAGDTGDGVK